MSAPSRIAALEERLRVYESLDVETIRIQGQTSLAATLSDQLLSDSDPKRGEERMVDILRQLGQLSIDRHMPQFYGGSSPDAVVDVIEAELGFRHTSETASILPRQSPPDDVRQSSWPSNCLDFPSFDAGIFTAILPQKTIADEYVGYYFRSTHRLYPVLNQKAFMSWYDRFWKIEDQRLAQHQLTILHMILALVYQGMAATSVDNQQDPLTMQENAATFFTAARDGLADAHLGGGDLSTINALILGVSPCLQQA